MPGQNPTLNQARRRGMRSHQRFLQFQVHLPRLIGLISLCSIWTYALPSSAEYNRPFIPPKVTQNFLAMERSFEKEFETYFGEDLADVTQDPTEVAQTLSRISQTTGTHPGSCGSCLVKIIYI